MRDKHLNTSNQAENLHHQSSDIQLCRLVINGDRDSHHFLIQKYQNYILAAAKQFLRHYGGRFCYQDEFDLTQNVLIRLPLIVTNYLKDIPVPFKNFLTGCIHHIFFDSIKSNLRHHQKFSANPDDLSFKSSAHSNQSPRELDLTRISVRSALFKLNSNNPALFEIINQSYFEELDDSEIALQTGRSRNQVWRIRQRALKKLAELV